MSKKKEGGGEPSFDLEQQFIMRLPPGPAAALRHDLLTENPHIPDKLSIELQSDLRRGAIRYGNEYIPAKLVDLPSIIESLKTVDKKTFYKTADISQMLVPTTEEEIAGDENEPVSKKKGDKDKKFMWNHGITPPLKNCRRRRFRKTLKKKYMEQPDIEKEVKRLFRADYEAIEVKWELINDEEKGDGEKGENSAGTGGGLSADKGQYEAIFGDLSSSDEDDEKDVNVLDSEDEASRQASSRLDQSGSQPMKQEVPYISMDSLMLGNQSMADESVDMNLYMEETMNSMKESIDASKNILDD
ncbi:transcription initiation factor TFIID subunit 7-like [Dreissena polymorpha]|uniref:transcription initiation factor TFIID subunit 7-like n=1 Tax=Dreissena polymorpha TaxID=45954 RepID=UPI00226443EF|nr:transcription initiation factor TFIID subunit 7-like [Dreissena polymorpha]